jgi:hypothetical protein
MWYTLPQDTAQSKDEIKYDTIGFMGSTATQSTFTLYLDEEKNGAKSYHVYLKELNGNSLTLTTGRTGAKDLTISTGTYVLIIYVDENGNINEQGTTATDVVVQGNTQPVTSDAVATAIQQGSDIYATKEYVNDVVSYSTDEQPTGGTWIDGKPIYRKVILNPTLNTTLLTGVDDVVNYRVKRQCYSTVSQGYVYFDGEHEQNDVHTSIYISLANNEVKLKTLHGDPFFNARWVILEYTKVTD